MLLNKVELVKLICVCSERLSSNFINGEINKGFDTHASGDDCLREQFTSMPGRIERNQRRSRLFHIPSYFLRRDRAVVAHVHSKKGIR